MGILDNSKKKLFGLIGYPLAHSFSKDYFTQKFIQQNIKNVEYKLFSIEKIEYITDIIKNNPELTGLNITIPYKESVISYLDKIVPPADEIGAVNTIKIIRGKKKTRLLGYNTDVYGFKVSLLPLLKSHHNKALVLGTGGSAKAVGYVLKELNIPFIFVSREKKILNNPKFADVSVITYQELNSKSPRLSSQPIDQKVAKELIKSTFLIINTTPAGMYPKIQEYPLIPYEYLTEKHLLYDLIYNPAETQFLKFASQQGAVPKNGLEMFYLQAEKSWEIWGQSKK